MPIKATGMRYEWKWRREPPDGADSKATVGSDGRTVKGLNVAYRISGISKGLCQRSPATQTVASRHAKLWAAGGLKATEVNE